MTDGLITVLAGVNGAGKSSVSGGAIRDSGADYFNPDEATRMIRAMHPDMSEDKANGLAWREGKRLLDCAIAKGQAFTFETTLGGNTITSTLKAAAIAGTPIRVVYTGLATVEMHIQRVALRVLKGGHDIPEAKIRLRYTTSRVNLVELMPHLYSLDVYDNSENADVGMGCRPDPLHVIRMTKGKLSGVVALERMPEWVKPIAMAALELTVPGICSL